MATKPKAKGSGGPRPIGKRAGQLPVRWRSGWLRGASGRGARADMRRSFNKAALARYEAICTDLGGEGEQTRITLDRVEVYAHCMAHVREMIGQAQLGLTIDDQRFFGYLDRAMGLSKLIGAERRSRRVPSLSEYLANREPEAARTADSTEPLPHAEGQQ